MVYHSRQKEGEFKTPAKARQGSHPNCQKAAELQDIISVGEVGDGTVEGKSFLVINQHRAYIVGPTPVQCTDRIARSGEEIYTVFVTLNATGCSITELIPEPASILTINWENTVQSQFEDPDKRWKGPVIQLPEHELLGCHFAMFALAKKDSVMQKAYPTLEEAKKVGAVPARLKFEAQHGINMRLKMGFSKLLKPEFKKFALMLMGRFDEAAKVPRNKRAILFAVKNAEFENRTPKEEAAFKQWGAWVMDHNTEEGPTKWCLNEQQLLAIDRLANTKFTKIIRGPPGTGKSRTAGCAVWASLAASNGQARVLVVASSNEATDAIASKIITCKPNDSRMTDALIIRLHVEGAEYHHAQQHGDQAEHVLAERRGQESDRLRNLRATFQIATLQNFRPEKMKLMGKEAREAHERHIAVYGLSLAEAIWQESGRIFAAVSQIPEIEREESEDDALKWATLYRKAADAFKGEALDTKSAETFRRAYQFLAQVVLTKASIVVTTCVNAASTRMTKSFKPDYLFVDESGQVPDTEFTTAATAFPGVRQIVLLGDPAQLQPTVTSTTRNEFSLVRKSTYISRALPHVDSVNLVVQYRMTPVIAEPVNQIFYQGQLKNAPAVLVPNQIVLLARKFFSQFIWKAAKTLEQTAEVIFMHIPDSKSWKDENGDSRVNHPEAECIVDIANSILRIDQKVLGVHNVSIICMYKSQGILIRKLLAAKIGAKAAAVQIFDISTIDAFQGKENDVVFLSLVHQGIDEQDRRVSNHVQDAHRLCVAISRARCALILVGHFHGLKTSTNPKIEANEIRTLIELHRYLLYLEDRGQVFLVPRGVYSDDSDQRQQADFEQRLQISEQDAALRTAADAISRSKRSAGTQSGAGQKRRK